MIENARTPFVVETHASDDQQPGNWSRWGDDDELGALNLVTPEVTRRATAEVRTGRTFGLAQPLGPRTATSPHRQGPSRFMLRSAGDYAFAPGLDHDFKFAEDVVQFATHSGTHVDALSHLWQGNSLYNNHPESSIGVGRGAQRCGAERLKPIVTRGVLLDIARVHGGPLSPRQMINEDDLERSFAVHDVTLEPGDAVLIRTGWLEAHGEMSDYFADEPGIGAGAARWLATRDPSVVGADNYAVEQQDGRSGFPAHLVLLHQHGTPLIENLVLKELADALAAEGRATFMFVLAPVPLVGSTGAPANPVAVL